MNTTKDIIKPGQLRRWVKPESETADGGFQVGDIIVIEGPYGYWKSGDSCNESWSFLSVSGKRRYGWTDRLIEYTEACDGE